jgi:2-deoxy-D-gluconate 3-dehydrogenase
VNRFSLEGKVALVTGSNTGLGQGICVAFAEAGAKVVGVSRSPSHETAEFVHKAGGLFHGIEADLAAAPLDNLVAETVRTFGRLDILVNNAGMIRRADLIDFEEKDWDDVLTVNLKSVFFLSQCAARQFISQGGGGKIINIASMLSFQGGIRVVSYTASKSGLAGITKSMANEWARHNIQVNAIAPGYMVTNNTAALRADPERSDDILKRIPAGRWGTPADLMGPAVFLASSAADYMNGAIVPVDGGWLAR